MTRRIVQLAGARAEFALAEDGTIWLWTGSGWSDASRGPLPAPPPAEFVTLPSGAPAIQLHPAFAEDGHANVYLAPPPQADAEPSRPLSPEVPRETKGRRKRVKWGRKP